MGLADDIRAARGIAAPTGEKFLTRVRKARGIAEPTPPAAPDAWDRVSTGQPIDPTTAPPMTASPIGLENNPYAPTVYDPMTDTTALAPAPPLPTTAPPARTLTASDKMEMALNSGMRGVASTIGSIPKAAGLATTLFEGDQVAKERASLEQLEREFAMDLSAETLQRPEAGRLYQAGAAIEGVIPPPRPELAPLQGSFLYDTLPGAAGSMATSIGTGVVGGALRVPSLIGMAGVGAAGEAASQYDQATAAGVPFDKAAAAAKLGGFVGTSETIPLERIINRATGGMANKVIKETIKGAIEEGLQEAGQTAAGNLIAKKYYDPNRPISEGVAEGAAAGAITGGGASGLAGLIARAKARRTGQPQQQGRLPGQPQNRITQAPAEPKRLPPDFIDAEFTVPEQPAPAGPPQQMGGNGRPRLALPDPTAPLPLEGRDARRLREYDLRDSVDSGDSGGPIPLEPGPQGPRPDGYDVAGPAARQPRIVELNIDGQRRLVEVVPDDGQPRLQLTQKQIEDGIKGGAITDAPAASTGGPGGLGSTPSPAPAPLPGQSIGDKIRGKKPKPTPEGGSAAATPTAAPPASPSNETESSWGIKLAELEQAEANTYDQQPAPLKPKDHGNLEAMSQHEQAREAWVKKYRAVVKAVEAHKANRPSQENPDVQAPPDQASVEPGGLPQRDNQPGLQGPRPDRVPGVQEQTQAPLEGAHDAATSPLNDRPEPTQAQKEAGNYKVGRVKFGGLDISIENPIGSERKGVDKGGKAWSVPMTAHYGYIKRTEGHDGDHVDVYLPDNPNPNAPVHVVNQVDPKTRKFDEHKVVLGVNTRDEALDIYAAHFSDGSGLQRADSIDVLSLQQFQEGLESGRFKKAPSRPANATAVSQENAHGSETQEGPQGEARNEGQAQGQDRQEGLTQPTESKPAAQPATAAQPASSPHTYRITDGTIHDAIDPQPANIKGFESFGFFTHRVSADEADRQWRVTEPKTGTAVGFGDSREGAIEDAIATFTKHGQSPEKLAELIARKVAERKKDEAGDFKGIPLNKPLKDLTDAELKIIHEGDNLSPYEKRNIELGRLKDDPRFQRLLTKGEIGYQTSWSDDRQPTMFDPWAARAYVRSGELTERGRNIQAVANLYKQLGADDWRELSRLKAGSGLLNAAAWGRFNDYLRPDNKTSRKVFEHLTGIKLPKGLRDTQAIFKGERIPLKPGVLGRAQTAVSEPVGTKSPTPTAAPAPAAAPEPTSSDNPQIEIAHAIKSLIRNKTTITADQLFEMADRLYGKTRAQGGYGPSEAYDALELGINLALRNGTNAAESNVNEAIADASEIARILDRIPTQTNRSGEKDLLQQFSTPPNYAFAISWIANVGPGDVVLEPSAGTGSLLVHALNAGVAESYANELSDKRSALVSELKPTQVFNENAEQIANILPKKMTAPTVVVMNPPFSRTGGRLGDKKDIMAGANHVEQALRLMAPNGRLVAIVGGGMVRFGAVSGGMTMEAPTYSDWWTRIKKTYNVRANIGVSGDVYKKYGTHFRTRVLVIDNTGPTTAPVLSGEVDSVSDLIKTLEDIRDDRVKSQGTEQALSPAPGASQGQAGSGSPVRAPAGQVGGGSGARPNSPTPATVSTGGRGGAPGSTTGSGSAGVAGGGRSGSQSGSNVGPKESGNSGPRPDSQSGRGDDALVSARSPSEGLTNALEVNQVEDEAGVAQLSETVYDEYRPSTNIGGAKKHPTELAESAAMASVRPPKLTYGPKIDAKLIQTGELSEVQIEDIAYAGQAHQKKLPNGERQGWFGGEGTGVGKGRIAAGTIIDNFNQGRTKAIWVSEKWSLMDDAKRDWGDLGQNKDEIISTQKLGTKDGGELTAKRAIAFVTYSSLRRKAQTSTAEGARARRRERLDHIIDWFGEDYDGLIVFDEAHNMGNGLQMGQGRGAVQPSAMALAGIELQERLPNARVLYLSATGATEVSNLSYADRLGLWGEGTAFSDKRDFITQIAESGVTGMEAVARDLKALGLYQAKTLSFRGIQYGRLEHGLTPEQVEDYDVLARAWQRVLDRIGAAIGQTGGGGKQRGAALSAFWSAHQRFFNQVLTSMTMPSVVKSIQNDIDAGKAVVVQIVNTNEASQERKLSSLDEGDDLDDLDMTPRDALIQYVINSFPVQQYEDQMDANGNIISVPVVDAAGNPVENAEAVAMRDALVDQLASIRVPEPPLEYLINHFGHEMVAEVTGRKRRVVRLKTGKNEIQRRGKNENAADVKAFRDDKKQILLFSDAGGTGASYHDDPKTKNTRPRAHYLLQAGWRANKAIQGLGRSRRSGQVHLPEYQLVTTDLPGHKRFISSIARRLDQLGALTKGSRQTGGQGLFGEKDNLESQYASDALHRMIRDMHRGAGDISMTLAEFEAQSGLRLRNEKDGSLRADLPGIPQFLNRLLSFTTDAQKIVFDAFDARLEAALEAARDAGTLDVGVETVRADKIEKIEDRTVHTDRDTEAETKYARVRLSHKNEIKKFDSMDKPGTFFARNRKSQRVYAFREGPTKADVDTGRTYRWYKRIGPAAQILLREDEVFDEKKWDRIDSVEAEPAWRQQAAEVPEYRTEDLHLITGQMLKIWNRLPGGAMRIYRLKTDAGEVMLGRVIPDDQIDMTLNRLGSSGTADQFDPRRILSSGTQVSLANGWRVRRSTVGGEARIEIIGPDYRAHNEFETIGVIRERIANQNRYFIPTGDSLEEVWRRLTLARPPVVSGGAGANPNLGDQEQQHRTHDDILRRAGFGPQPFGGFAMASRPVVYPFLVNMAGKVKKAAVEAGKRNKALHRILARQRGEIGTAHLDINAKAADLQKLRDWLKLDPDNPYNMNRAMVGEFPMNMLPRAAQAWVKQARAMHDAASRDLIDELVMANGGESKLTDSIRNNIGTYLAETLIPKSVSRKLREFATRKHKLRGEQFKFKRDKWAVRVGDTHFKFDTQAEAHQFAKDLVNQAKTETIKKVAKDRGVDADDLNRLAAKHRKIQVIKPIPEDKRREMFIRDPLTQWAISYAKTRQNAANLQAFRMIDRKFAEPAPVGMTEAETEAWAKENGYEQVKGTKNTVGVLAGKYAPKRIAREVNEMVRAVSRLERIWTGYLNLWKMSKTVLNPATHFRNVIGNAPFADFAGVDPTNPANLKWYIAAGREIRAQGEDYRWMVKQGVIGAEYFGNEVERVTKYLEAEPETALDSFINAGRTIGDTMGKAYNVEDQIFKMAAYLKYRNRGIPRLKAARQVNRWFPNYAELWGVTKFLSRRLIGAPFLAFNEQSARIAGRAVVDHPLKLAKWAALPGIMTALTMYLLGMDDDERELVNSRRTYAEPILPFRDEKGAVRTLDLRYVLPWANELQGFVGSEKGVVLPGLLQQPIIGGAVDASRNRDPFTNREIFKADDTKADKVAKSAWHMLKGAIPAPSLLQFGFPRIKDAVTDKSRESVFEAVAGAVTGVNARGQYVRREDAYDQVRAIAKKDPAVADFLQRAVGQKTVRMSYKELERSLTENRRFQNLLDLFNEAYRRPFQDEIKPRGILQSIRASLTPKTKKAG